MVVVMAMISITDQDWVEDYDRKMRDAGSDWDTLWLSQPRNLHQILLPRIISNVSLKPSLTEQSQGRDHIRPLRGNHGMVGFIIITDSTNGHQSGCQWLPTDWETCPAQPGDLSRAVWFQTVITGRRDYLAQVILCCGLTLHYQEIAGDNTPVISLDNNGQVRLSAWFMMVLRHRRMGWRSWYVN